MTDDIVSGFIRRVRALHPEIAGAEWQRLEIRLRQEWGGERFYVQKAPAAGKAYSLAESLAAGVSLREALKGAGLKPGSGYARRFVVDWGSR